ncbi:hypothetical protein SSX86_004428 [Deinandra increscens subsp. villosa]|uniref:Uncharacterized protein n=1 Tax=Deinandra increscens subsp. villosa TaxID=3103831 RepID=A0AAP0HAX1_9ASTR
MSDLQFDSSSAGIGEICKAIICLEIAANMKQVLFDRQTAIRLSGMSEKAYIRSFNVMQNGIGVKNTLDIKELAIQFGCVRLIPLVRKGLSFNIAKCDSITDIDNGLLLRYLLLVELVLTSRDLCLQPQLKVDKNKLIELSGTSEDEFSSVSTSMKDLCHDVFGVSTEKKDPKSVKVNRDLLDVLPEKRQAEDGGYSSDEGKDV